MVSVIIPVYNGASTIVLSIESVLNQSFSDFELLIGNDGSTDDTLSVVEGICDPRIRTIDLPHDFISTLNHLIDQSKGKYIARLDADDMMLPDRLKIQVEYMESHPEIAVLGGLTENINHSDWFKAGGEIRLADLCESNRLIHPSVIIRRDALIESGLRYEQDYKYAEDFRLWSLMARKGYRLMNLPVPLIRYGLSETQVSRVHHSEMMRLTAQICRENRTEAINKANSGYNDPEVSDNRRDLTVVVTFLNEGQEAVNTLKNIREMFGSEVDIFAVNDGSCDGFNYMDAISSLDNIYYFLNRERKGVAGARDEAISHIRTPYFLLLDGHMRAFNKSTGKTLVSMLRENDRRILCCQTAPLIADSNGELVVSPSYDLTFGAYTPTENYTIFPDIDWIKEELSPDRPIEPIPLILGAAYAASKRYWEYLGGLNGLRCWGCDETYISYKAWLEGGECVLLKNHTIGHLYRPSTPYLTSNIDLIYNKLLISELLFTDRLLNKSHASAMAYDFNLYRESMARLKSENRLIGYLKNHIKSISTRTFNDIKQKHKSILNNRIVPSREKMGHELQAPTSPLIDGWLICLNAYKGENIETLTAKLTETDILASQIDLTEMDLKRFTDGAGILLAYLTARLQTDVAEVDQDSPIMNPAYFTKAREIASRILVTAGCDEKSYFHAREFIFAINCSNTYEWEPELCDVI